MENKELMENVVENLELDDNFDGEYVIYEEVPSKGNKVLQGIGIGAVVVAGGFLVKKGIHAAKEFIAARRFAKEVLAEAEECEEEKLVGDETVGPKAE